MTDTTNTPPAESEELLHIPPSVLVGCPKAAGRLTRLEKCPGCEHFAGLADRFGDGSKQPFAVRYLLSCGHPRNLPLSELEA